MPNRVSRYEEMGLGLPYPVTLIDGVEEQIDIRTGEVKEVVVRGLERMVAAVALSRALNPLTLDGRELKFARHAIGTPAKVFAEDLCFSPVTLSRWENNAMKMGSSAEKQVRMAVILALRDKVPGFKIDPTEVIKLKLVQRPAGEWPHIQLICRSINSEDQKSDEDNVTYGTFFDEEIVAVQSDDRASVRESMVIGP